MPYRTGGCDQAGSLMTLTSFSTVAASVRYTKPASASPSATFASTLRTSGSWLTTFDSTAALMPRLRRICRV